jgi:hypothetical protein
MRRGETMVSNNPNNTSGTPARTDLKEAARELGDRFGFHTFPVSTPANGRGGKKPLLKGWEQAAGRDGQLFAGRRDANIGVALGRSGHIVLDVDGPQGEEAAASLFGGEIPETLCAITGRDGGGRHYYFRLPHGMAVRSRNRIAPGLDLKAGGGFVVAPPSEHKSGRLYRWDDPDTRIAMLTREQADSLAEHSSPAEGALSSEELEQRCAPGEGPERIAFVREMLDAISNDVEFRAREDWIGMAHSVKVALGEDLEAEALEVFDEWSQRWEGDGDKRYDRQETKHAFESLSASRSGGFPSLKRMAEERGHEPSARLVMALQAKRAAEANEDFDPIPGAAPPTLSDPFSDSGTSPPWLQKVRNTESILSSAARLFPSLPPQQRQIGEAALIQELRGSVGPQLAGSLVRRTLHPDARTPFGEAGTLWPLDIAAADLQAQYLVPGLVPAAAVGLLIAPQSLGKSFLAIDLALSVAFGVPWLGRTPVDGGPALFVLAEGQAAFPVRLASWLVDHRLLEASFTRRKLSDALQGRAVIAQSAPHLDDPRLVDGLIKSIRAFGSRVVVLDTLGRLLGGEQSDDNNDTANGVMRDLHEVAVATGATVLLVHHTGHENKGRARGASAWEQAADFVYLLHGTAEDFSAGLPVDLINKKMKDGELVQRMAIAKRSVPMVLEGADRSSAVVDQARPIEPIPDEVLVFRVVQEHGGLGARELREVAPCGKDKVGSAREELLRLGAIENRKTGNRHRYFVVTGWSVAFDEMSLVPPGAADPSPATDETAPDLSDFDREGAEDA